VYLQELSNIAWYRKHLMFSNSAWTRSRQYGFGLLLYTSLLYTTLLYIHQPPSSVCSLTKRKKEKKRVKLKWATTWTKLKQTSVYKYQNKSIQTQHQVRRLSSAKFKASVNTKKALFFLSLEKQVSNFTLKWILRAV
jgi:hypothetical protein